MRVASPLGRRPATLRPIFLAVLLPTLVALLPARVSADFSILSPVEFQIDAVDSSSFKYYGRKLRKGESIEGTAVVLGGKNLCAPQREDVEGKVVVALRDGRYCDLQKQYVRLDRAGALAFVSITGTGSPGLFCYRHGKWDMSAIESRSLVLVEVVKRAFADDQRAEFQELFEGWKKEAKRGELRVAVGWRDNRFYRDVYESWLWTLLFRVGMPLWAFYASAVAAGHSYSYHAKRTEWGPGRVVCLLEAPANVLIGVGLACGVLGPTIMPHRFTFVMITLFSGVSNTTSILLALFMREAARAVGARTRRRNVWQVHRRKLLAFLVFQIAIENLLPYVFSYFASPLFLAVFLGMFITFISLQLACFILYNYHALLYVQPLQKYLAHPDSKPRQAYVEKVAVLVFYLKVSAICMALQSVGTIIVSVAIVFREIHVAVIHSVLFTFIFSRITLSYAQIRSVATTLPSQRGHRRSGLAILTILGDLAQLATNLPYLAVGRGARDGGRAAAASSLARAEGQLAGARESRD